MASLPAQEVSYDGHKVVRVAVDNRQEAAQLEALGLDIWTCSASVGIGSIPVRVSPQQLAQLQQTGLRITPWIEDVGPMIAAQKVRARGASYHESYHTLSEIHAELQQMATNHAAIAQTVNMGTSLENRTLLGLRITGPGSTAGRPGLFIFGGEHAREWIGPATMMYIADWLLTNYGTDAQATQLINEIEWFILPVMNPDGYEFTWSSQRLWRKNRRVNGGGSFGVDLNRNWGYEWGQEGTSPDPSSDIYHGPSPFSEPETQALRDFILAHDNITAMIDYHNFSELILWPWGYTAELSVDQEEFSHIGVGLHDSIEAVHNHSYTFGPVYTAIYPASGVSVDWTYGANISERFIAAFSIELRDTGASGFLLPPDQIIPTGEENLEGILFFAEAIEPMRAHVVSPVPVALSPGESYSVTARVVPRSQSPIQDGVELVYRLENGNFTSIPMAFTGAPLYEVALPLVNCGDLLEFYVRATGDLGGIVTDPKNAPAKLFTIPVGVSFTHITDSLETLNGWSVGDVGDNATTGVWTRVNPIGTSSQPEDDYTPPPGTFCFVTGQGSIGGSVGENDVDNGKTTLFSPVFDVPLDTFTISYALWFNTTGTTDTLVVSASNDAGGSWTPVETLTLTTSGWTVHSFRPVDLGLTASTQMKLRFVAADNNPGTICEAAIDEFVVSKFGCPDGDYNEDDLVNLLDSAAIFDCLNGPAALSVSAVCGVFNFDFDPDVDMRDYLDFTLRFGQ